MSGLSLEELSACLLYSVEHLDRENHLAALEHRQKLTRAWGIPPGASVLEIGPGQGELTVVLGDAVGPQGRVVAIDNAPLSWGTPDYASSQAHVRASAVGNQISFVEGDPIAYLSGGVSELTFDFIVFGYSIWYFSGHDILSKMLQKARLCAQTVLVAEHSLSARQLAQVPHLLAALTDNALESFRGEESRRNIRCALTPEQIKRLAADAGWVLAKEEMATPSPKQIDGKMEVRMVLNSRMFRGDLDAVIYQADPKIGILLHGMVDAVAASVQNLEGGLDDVINMDIWLARFEKDT
ncbi:SAM-dependent methyltransferase [Diaporthe helianthi]|uniref:SAM-dependent methyltransferase n=1 Tax=Diaporthe helianthi TaxID=158607 RepID=A0A2P5HV68_DIAHE|nr:SAM-dependent methyltransferase [Diaporthe helianthi]